jgi:protein-disulfide isomerase-like protein with CxxC motif
VLEPAHGQSGRRVASKNTISSAGASRGAAAAGGTKGSVRRSATRSHAMRANRAARALGHQTFPTVMRTEHHAMGSLLCREFARSVRLAAPTVTSPPRALHGLLGTSAGRRFDSALVRCVSERKEPCLSSR